VGIPVWRKGIYCGHYDPPNGIDHQAKEAANFSLKNPFQMNAKIAQTLVSRSDSFPAQLNRDARQQAKKYEFRMARHLAATLLKEVGSPDTFVGVAQDRSPIWPRGFTGSITHTSQLVGVAIGRLNAVRGLGIDAERIANAEEASNIESVCLNQTEEDICTMCVDKRVAVTLCFSAKESFFKCLHPITKTFFDFADAEITKLDFERGEIGIRLLRDLNWEFQRGFALVGHFGLYADHILTSFEIAHSQSVSAAAAPPLPSDEGNSEPAPITAENLNNDHARVKSIDDTC
jgi:enterobactin synthetase component D